MTEVIFYDPDFKPDKSLTYSVIAASYLGRWIFVRHQGRSSWEIAAGHIEAGESPAEAASRELKEETGALEFNIVCVATYSVSQNGSTGFGRLYLAEVFRLGAIPDISEIAEITFLEGLPEQLTYPDIQTELFRKCLAAKDGDAAKPSGLK